MITLRLFVKSAEFLLDCINFYIGIESDYNFIYEGDFKKDIRDIVTSSYIYSFRNYPSTFMQEVHFINRMASRALESRNISKYLTEKSKWRNIEELKFNLLPDNPRFKESIEILFSYPFNDDIDRTQNTIVDGYSLYEWFKIMIGYYATSYNGTLINWFSKDNVKINNFLEKDLYLIVPRLT